MFKPNVISTPELLSSSTPSRQSYSVSKPSECSDSAFSSSLWSLERSSQRPGTSQDFLSTQETLDPIQSQRLLMYNNYMSRKQVLPDLPRKNDDFDFKTADFSPSLCALNSKSKEKEERNLLSMSKAIHQLKQELEELRTIKEEIKEERNKNQAKEQACHLDVQAFQKQMLEDNASHWKNLEQELKVWKDELDEKTENGLKEIKESVLQTLNKNLKKLRMAKVQMDSSPEKGIQKAFWEKTSDDTPQPTKLETGRCRRGRPRKVGRQARDGIPGKCSTVTRMEPVKPPNRIQSGQKCHRSKRVATRDGNTNSEGIYRCTRSRSRLCEKKIQSPNLLKVSSSVEIPTICRTGQSNDIGPKSPEKYIVGTKNYSGVQMEHIHSLFSLLYAPKKEANNNVCFNSSAGCSSESPFERKPTYGTISYASNPALYYNFQDQQNSCDTKCDESALVPVNSCSSDMHQYFA